MSRYEKVVLEISYQLKRKRVYTSTWRSYL